MPAAKSPDPQSHLEKLQQLAAQLAQVGFIVPGTVYSRYMPCGKASCRCQADPPQLHGPYWEWSRSVGGRTLSRRLSEPQARLYQQWIANRRRLSAIVGEMEAVSLQAAELTLHQQARKIHRTQRADTPAKLARQRCPLMSISGGSS